MREREREERRDICEGKYISISWGLSHLFKLFLGHDENPAHKRAVVVEWVELRGGDMKRTLCWVVVLEGIVQWQ